MNEYIRKVLKEYILNAIDGSSSSMWLENLEDISGYEWAQVLREVADEIED